MPEVVFSENVQMNPGLSTATSLLPSADRANPPGPGMLVSGFGRWGTQVIPEFQDT